MFRLDAKLTRFRLDLGEILLPGHFPFLKREGACAALLLDLKAKASVCLCRADALVLHPHALLMRHTHLAADAVARHAALEVLQLTFAPGQAVVKPPLFGRRALLRADGARIAPDEVRVAGHRPLARGHLLFVKLLISFFLPVHG